MGRQGDAGHSEEERGRRRGQRERVAVEPGMIHAARAGPRDGEAGQFGADEFMVVRRSEGGVGCVPMRQRQACIEDTRTQGFGPGGSRPRPSRRPPVPPRPCLFPPLARPSSRTGRIPLKARRRDPSTVAGGRDRKSRRQVSWWRHGRCLKKDGKAVRPRSRRAG